jgi:hypothetical protein
VYRILGIVGRLRGSFRLTVASDGASVVPPSAQP